MTFGFRQITRFCHFHNFLLMVLSWIIKMISDIHLAQPFQWNGPSIHQKYKWKSFEIIFEKETERV